MVDDSQGSHIPTADVIKLLGMSIGLAYFIYLIIVDAWTSLFRKPCTMWISGKALILSALTIQILTYLDYKNISISDVPDYEQYTKLLDNQVVIDSGRLVICVFIGYLLPGMARPGSASQWGDILALVISLFSAITSELYYIRKTDKLRHTSFIFYWQLKHEKNVKLWFMVSSLVVLVLTVMLILLLISAILAGKTVRGMLSKRMQSVIKRSSNTHSSDSGEFEDYLERFEDGLKKFEDERMFEEYLGKFEDEIMRLWVLCRVGKPQYVIARSVLSSSVALLVTFSFVLLVFKGIYFKSRIIIRHHDGWDLLRFITFGLQCAFILLGWVVILWRYFTSVFYIPRSFSSGRSGRERIIGCLRCVVEDFWTRSISELVDMYDLHRWRLAQLPRSDKKCSGRIIGYATVLKFHKLLYFIWHLQNFMVLFSKCCWFISWIVLRCKCIQKFLLGMDKMSLYYSYQDETHLYQEFLKYRDALQHICMPGEHPAGVWLADERAFRQAQERFKNGSHKRWDYLNLFLTNHFHWDNESILSQLQQLDLVKEYFPTMNENCWKMTAVSFLRIIKAVSSLHEDSSLNAETAMKACQQAWDSMTFADIEQPISVNVVKASDYELDQVSMSADNEFKKLKAGKCLYNDKLSRGQKHSAHQVLRKLLKEAETELIVERLLAPRQDDQAHEDDHDRIPLDSIDWNAVAPAYHMYRVCKLILNEQASHGNDSVNIMVNHLCDLLAGVIGHCLLELPCTIVLRCREWAVKYQEQNIWEAIYIAGQTRAVQKHLFEAKLIKNNRSLIAVEHQPVAIV